MLIIDKSIAQKLLNFGACPRCIFRFCRIGSQDLYRRPYKNTTEENKLPCETANPPHKRIKLDSVKEGEEQTSNGSHQVPNAENDRTAGGDENLRPAVCSICLGILQELCEMDFVKAVSVSWLVVLLKQDFLAEKEDLVQLKEAYKWIIHPLFLEQLGVPADGKSLFEVSVVFAHPETDEDCHFLASACPSCFKQEKNKQSVFTRMAVVKALDMISEEDFLKHFQCPLTSPKVPCTAVDIQCTNGAIFVAGRYNKYSRTLPQTPWIIDGERKMESSVEELISEHLMAAFKADSFNFSSSGREDVDVRTLGKGRPFAIELVNPRKVRLAAEEMKELQQIINNSSDKVQVRDLQLVTREAIGHMKEGEEAKTKTYSALIWTEKAIRNEDIELLDNMKELKLDQKTPLRVLHRRPLAVRVRVIYTMQSEYIDEHHFRLHLKTQAGTYIKEFVHGDFGRTKPNIGTLLGTTADILELDVESVDVDWPPALDDK
uniref:tRNA pseudouridine synthase Pus10 n=1 Tax=Podarcis muralis TaxID=64176 RepID=A0A670I6P7_PODMU